MSHYEFYTPVALSAQNYNAFTDLLAAQSSGTLMPRDLAQFVAGHEHDALSPVISQDGKPYFLERNEKGGFTQIMIWAPKSTPDDISRMVALFVDLHTGKDDALTYEPRQWIIGGNAQVVVSYRMTCCPGSSSAKTTGTISPLLGITF